MSSDFRVAFLTYYIQSLGERTREEKSGTKYGFDWIIYNISLANDWIPHRLPFLRTGASETSKTKTEAEFGIDMAFVSADQKTLRIFALKDEVLNNKNWGKHKFDVDIRMAVAPDLSVTGLESVENVEVILAYNKDEDATGIKLFDLLVASLGTKVGDDVALRIDRWNLTRIVNEVDENLLTPSLLPQKFFSHFSYICAQFGEFHHGSDSWELNLIPNWCRFLDELFSENADERCVRLLPVALLLLLEHGKGNPTKETGWIDLMEWGMLSMWRVLQSSKNKKKLTPSVVKIWIDFYLVELERYYRQHNRHLGVDLSLDKPLTGSFVDAIATSMVAHWHIARLGLLSISYAECLPQKTEAEKSARDQALNDVANWLIQLLNANPSAMRPLFDIHHIQLFLTWGTMIQARRLNDAFNFLHMLSNRLFTRRAGNAEIPFLDGNNSLESVLETVATGTKPDEFCESSSVFLLILMELTFVMPDDQRDALLMLIYQRLVLAQADDGQPLNGTEPITLMSWIPASDWGDKVLKQSMVNEGECATIHFGDLGDFEPESGGEIASNIRTLVSETRANRTFNFPNGITMAATILACIKFGSPIPPEMWRRISFGPIEGEKQKQPKKTRKKK